MNIHYSCVELSMCGRQFSEGIHAVFVACGFVAVFKVLMVSRRLTGVAWLEDVLMEVSALISVIHSGVIVERMLL